MMQKSMMQKSMMQKSMMQKSVEHGADGGNVAEQFAL